MRDYLQSRLALVCYCGIAAFAGWALRDDRPIEVATNLNEARDLVRLAVDRQNAAVQEYSVSDHDNDRLAGTIDVETLPRLREAVGLTEQAAAAGAKGEAFDAFRAYAKARLDAAEMLVDALRSNDASKLAAARRLVEEGARLGKSLFATTAQADDLNRPAVIHIGH